jgi:5-methylcytosine-specific restriction endonuclease McrA
MTTSNCPICGRVLGDIGIEDHHLIPKTFKGKETVELHRICHRKIHATFTERELLQYFNTAERLLENEDIQKFVKWVQKKDPSFYDGSDETKRRKAKRGR